MEEKSFQWTTELAKKMFRLRFKNDELFEKKKQPWEQFHRILLENGFPEEMTVAHVRKKWGYHLDIYRSAKKRRKTNVNYYKIFDKYLGQQKVIDKYGSWTDEWRTILISAITEATEMKMDQQTLWMNVENTLRSQDLPEDCCIQDIKSLWHHLKTMFARRYRIALKKDDHDVDWPQYSLMLNYYKKFDPEALTAIEVDMNKYAGEFRSKENGKCSNKKRKSVENNPAGETETEFTWTKDITETLIVAKLQNDWLFKERGQPWRDFTEILKREHGFPGCLTPLQIGRKWATIYSDYQKSKATNNTSWMYYNLFEVHMQSGFCYNPINQWEEEWLHRLITIRTNLEQHFTCDYFNRTGPRHNGWREVEKKLRAAGIPKSHSLLELREIWSYLRSTFKWKHKFAVKGMLTEYWPYYDAIAFYEVQRKKQNNNINLPKDEKEETVFEQDMLIDEDDLTLIDLKQKLTEKPKAECEVKCRACASADTLVQCVDIYEYRDDTGTDLASKLKIVAGIEVDKSDSMTNLICHNCLQELENAYEFRQKCQSTDKMLREEQNRKFEYTIKLEIEHVGEDTYDDSTQLSEEQNPEATNKDTTKTTVKKEGIQRKRRLKPKPYQYHKMCEVCGKVTKNITAHMDSHADEKRHTCDLCGKKFKFRGALIIHKQVHHMPPTRKETCEVCGKVFRTKAQYKRHFMIHTNERKFGCETCGKRFNSTEVLKVHNRMHTDERPFSCSDCGKRFRTAGCVTRHKRIVHNKTVNKTTINSIGKYLVVYFAV